MSGAGPTAPPPAPALPAPVPQPAPRIDEILAALADPTRRRLLDVLAGHGEATATTLAAELPVTRQAVVKHLGVLDAAGLVTHRRIGREVRYAVRPDRLDATARWLAARAAAWDARLGAIKRLAESGGGPPAW